MTGNLAASVAVCAALNRRFGGLARHGLACAQGRVYSSLWPEGPVIFDYPFDAGSEHADRLFRQQAGLRAATVSRGSAGPRGAVDMLLSGAMSKGGQMLLNGVNHVAILTGDADRLVAFYREVFEAEPAGRQGFEGFWLTIIRIGEAAEINVFQIDGNTEADRQTPMFGRGRIDHVGLLAASMEAFDQIRDRLIARGASDQFVTDFGPTLSVFFRDPDGLEGEVCVPNPDAVPGVYNPPGTPAARYAPQP